MPLSLNDFQFSLSIFSSGNVMASKKEDCVICHKKFVDGADKAEVGKRGLATLIEFSKKEMTQTYMIT